MTDTHLQTRSSTAVVLEELQLYGWRPFTDEPDPRPLPEPDAIRTAVADIFDALVSTLSDSSESGNQRYSITARRMTSGGL